MNLQYILIACGFLVIIAFLVGILFDVEEKRITRKSLWMALSTYVMIGGFAVTVAFQEMNWQQSIWSFGPLVAGAASLLAWVQHYGNKMNVGPIFR